MLLHVLTMLKYVLIGFSFLLFAVSAAAAPTELQGQDLFSGKPVRLQPHMARPTVVIFVSARCPCSASHEEIIKPLAKEFQDFDFIAVHANANETEAETRAHFEKTAFAFPLIEDRDGRWAETFQALKTPHAFVVDKQGNIVFSGGVTDASHGPTAKIPYLKNALNEFRQTGKIKESKRRALGCAIRRREKS